MKKHSITLNGHRTSISLEDEFWIELQNLAASDNRALQDLVQDIDRNRSGNLSSALRLYVLEKLKKS